MVQFYGLGGGQCETQQLRQSKMDNTQLYQERRSPENGCIKPSEPYERFIFADFNKSQYDAQQKPQHGADCRNLQGEQCSMV